MGQEFKEFEATVGVDFSEYIIENIDENNPNICLSVQIWDTCKKFNFYFLYNQQEQRGIGLLHLGKLNKINVL